MTSDSNLSFQPVVTPRAFEQVCIQIRQMLAAGALKAGDKLPPERTLAETLKVSRGVVREALRTLEIAGLIQLRKGGKGGAFVTSGQSRILTQAFQDMIYLGNISLTDLTEARQKFVIDAIEIVCERAVDEDFDAIERNIDRTEEAYKKGVLELGLGGERARLAVEFYHLLGVATKNPVIVMTVDAITSMLLRFFIPVANRPPLQLIQSRRRFIKYLRARDKSKASREMSTFLIAVHHHILAGETPQPVRTSTSTSNERG